MNMIKNIKYFPIIILLFTSCIFSPKTGGKTVVVEGEIVEPTSPRNVINNLKVAFTKKNINFFEDCLHPNYYYISPSTVDSLDISWSRSEDLRIVTNVMEASREIIFTPSEINVDLEYGKNVPNIPDGENVVDDHPDEIWYICSYYITMDIFTYNYGTFRVQQDMKFKMVKDSDTNEFSIIQWYDESPTISGKRAFVM